MNKKSLFLVSLLTVFSSSIRAEEQAAFIQFVRPLAMGGAFTAVADDQNIFGFNPAGMVQRTGSLITLLEVGVGGSEDLKDAADFIDENEDKLTNFDTLSAQQQLDLITTINNDISKLNPRATVTADFVSLVSGPRFLGLPMHVGFGAFGIVDANFRLDADIIPTISYAINNDIVLPLSIAHRFSLSRAGKIGIGLTGKIIRRNQIQQEKISVLQLDSLDSPPLATGRGFGSDLGVLYQPGDRLNVGLMVQDFLGTKMKFDKVDAEDGFSAQPERDTVIRPRTNIGVAVVPKKIAWLLPTNDRWTLTADVRDILSPDEHIFFQNGIKKVFGEDIYTHVHLGAEFRYWFLRFRGGAYQGYPSGGLGVDIPFLKIDYAFYSRELGEKAGDLRETNHVVSLALRFGTGKTESRERIKKAKESKKLNEVAEPETTPESTSAPQESVPASSDPMPDAAPAK
jgi:hypothetical protein